jgi:hypothetical protein
MEIISHLFFSVNLEGWGPSSSGRVLTYHEKKIDYPI